MAIQFTFKHKQFFRLRLSEFVIFYLFSVITFVPVLEVYIVSFKLSNYNNAENNAAIKYGKPFSYITK